MKELFIFAVLVILCAQGKAWAQEAQIKVDASVVTNSISRHMTGACIEDVNHEIYGGIYSQMIFGESFQEPASTPEAVSGMWRSVQSGTAKGAFALEPGQAFLRTQSQRLTFAEGQGELGIENQGLNRWGLYFVEGKPYEGRLWVRSEKPADLYVALESGDGAKVYAETRLHSASAEWQPLDFNLAPSGTDTAGRFTIKLKQPSSVAVGYAFLQPGAWGRFKDLPVRKDVAEGLLEQGLTVLRYGGSMVNAEGYRWKNMIGPRDKRPPYKGTWYPYSTNGWAIVDFVAFCRAAGFLCVPAFNMGETPEDMADFIEYMNGPADSEWGRKRMEDGFPEPFNLKYIELGNEEKIDENYWQHFKPMAEAIWAKDPNITVVVGDLGYAGVIQDPFNFTGNPTGLTTLATYQQILELAKSHNRTIWADIHLSNNEPTEPNPEPIRSFIEALGKLCPGADYKVAVFEENSGNHLLRRGLGHAHAINVLERMGGKVPVVCAANCLQPYKQTDNGWDQGLLFLSPSQVWGQPSYYVTQMVSRNYLPKCVKSELECPDNTLDVTAKTSEDGTVLTLQVVNMVERAVPARIHITGFTPTKPSAEVSTISGSLEDENTPEEPKRIIPQQREWEHQFQNGIMHYEFPAYSFTILNLNGKPE